MNGIPSSKRKVSKRIIKISYGGTLSFKNRESLRNFSSRRYDIAAKFDRLILIYFK